MSFFSRLRERLTKSSSRIDQGVDALIAAAPEPQPAPAPVTPQAASPAAPGPVAARPSAPAPSPDGAAGGQTAAPQDAAPSGSKDAPAAAPVGGSGAEPEATPAPAPAGMSAPAPAGMSAPAPAGASEAAPQGASAAAPAGASAAAPLGASAAAPLGASAAAPLGASAAAPLGASDAALRATDAAQTPPRAAGAGAPRPAPGRADAAVAPAQGRTGAAPADAPPPARPGFFARLIGRGGEAAPAAAPARADAPRRALDDAMLADLEELLIQADLGVETALRVAANMAEGRFGRRLTAAEVKALLADEVARILQPVARPLPIYPHRPQVVLVVGVNGSGKTTTIGKLASQLKAAGKSVVIAAGDTFRAAAVEQLVIWGQRAGVPVLKADQGTDPASLAFDAMTRARADGADLLLIDTAGRLQNRADLMEELAKIVRVLRKVDPTAPHNTVLVLDATTGQNALTQVEVFRKVADVTGLVMTKLDGTAKGGVLVALADRFGLPIHAIGVGEQIDDLAPFDPDDFARALTGADA